MTTIMNQETCLLCDIKVDELEWMYQNVPTNHLQLCENNKNKIAIRFFEMIFVTYSEISEKHNLKNGKPDDFWKSYFATKLPNENFSVLCSNLNDISEIETVSYLIY